MAAALLLLLCSATLPQGGAVPCVPEGGCVVVEWPNWATAPNVPTSARPLDNQGADQPGLRLSAIDDSAPKCKGCKERTNGPSAGTLWTNTYLTGGCTVQFREVYTNYKQTCSGKVSPHCSDQTCNFTWKLQGRVTQASCNGERIWVTEEVPPATSVIVTLKTSWKSLIPDITLSQRPCGFQTLRSVRLGGSGGPLYHFTVGCHNCN